MFTITVRNEHGKEVRLYTTTDINNAYQNLSYMASGDSTAEVKEIDSTTVKNERING